MESKADINEYVHALINSDPLGRQVKCHLKETLNVVRQCPCQSGCPSCVHSPKCGSGNRPIDKEGAGIILDYLIGNRTE